MKKLLSVAALTLLLTLTASQAMAQTVHTIPAANRAPNTYGPLGPWTLGAAENSVDIQFNSTNWSVAGGTFVMVCDRLPAGMADVPGNWVLGDFSDSWQTGGVDRNGNPNVPHVRYDCLPNDTVRVTFTVGGKSINLGATVTTSAKQ